MFLDNIVKYYRAFYRAFYNTLYPYTLIPLYLVYYTYVSIRCISLRILRLHLAVASIRGVTSFLAQSNLERPIEFGTSYKVFTEEYAYSIYVYTVFTDWCCGVLAAAYS